MTIWLITIALLLLALALLLPPLFRKDITYDNDRQEQNIAIAKQQLATLETEYQAGNVEQAEYHASKDELEQSLYQDLQGAESGTAQGKRSPIALTAIGLFIPICTIGVYLIVGAPLAIPESSKVVAEEASQETPDIANMLTQLEQKLAEDPNDAEGWFMLGRTYSVMQRNTDAIKAYEKSNQLKPNQPKVLLFLADVTALQQKGDLKGKPEQLIKQALAINPQNPMGLWLAGIAAKQQGQDGEALNYLTTLEPLLQPDSEEHIQVKALIADLNRSGVTSPSAQQTTEEKPKGNEASITLTVSLSPALADRVSPEQTVFIYAKALSGPPMPLAAAKKQVKDLPITLKLDDSMAMLPQLKLSNVDQVAVGARISLSGQPVAQSGDFYMEQSPVQLGGSVSIEIQKTVE